MIDFYIYMVGCFKFLLYTFALLYIVDFIRFIVFEVVIKNFNKDLYQQLLDYKKEQPINDTQTNG